MLTIVCNAADVIAFRLLRYQKKSGPNAAPSGDIAALRDHARALITYVNKIPYRMPWDIMNELLAAHASIAG